MVGQHRRPGETHATGEPPPPQQYQRRPVLPASPARLPSVHDVAAPALTDPLPPASIATPRIGESSDDLTARVLARVRDRDLDPLREPALVSALIDELTGSAPADAAVIDEVKASVIGYGPLQPYFDDPTVEEIWINAPDRIFIFRGGRSELTPTVLTEVAVRGLVERMLRTSSRRVDVSSPFVDATLPDGSRLHVVAPDIVRSHMSVNIRRFAAPIRRLSDQVTSGVLTIAQARLLREAVLAGQSIIVAGATGAGKTTLLSCLLNECPTDQRIVTCEEVFELRLASPDWVAMQTRQPNLEGVGEVPLRRLVKEAMRMRPDRLVIGEVRQAEALDLLIALNSGTPGMGTLHANSAREALLKLCTLPLLAGQNIAAAFVTPTVAAAIDMVVVLRHAPGRGRHVSEIVTLSGRVENGVIEMTPVDLP